MSITTSSALPPTNAAIANRRHLHLSTAERRIRNRSLCSLLWTPPLYPGYSAKLENSPKSNCHRSSRKSATSEIPTSSNPILPDPDQTVNGFCSSSIRSVIKSADKREVLSHLQQGENEEMNWNSPKKYTNSKESSGYGSGTSESDLENELQTKKSLENTTTITDSLNIDGDSVTNATTMSDNYNNIFDERTTNRTPIRQQYNRHFTLEKSRRRSVPANLRDAFTDEIVRVLEINGVFQYETDADTGVRRPIVREQSINRPESVIQLARKFAEASAVQDKRIYISNQKLIASRQNSTTLYSGDEGNNSVRNVIDYNLHHHPLQLDTFNKKPGGIACLYNDKMSKVNVFKQMDQMHRASQPQAGRPLNPSSIKNALLRWCQIKLENYPVKITNFSSCWADGMAFCALIHRFVPDSFDFNTLNPRNRRENLELAFRVAEQNGIVPLLEVDDMLLMGDRPDWKCVFTYVQSFYKAFKDHL